MVLLTIRGDVELVRSSAGPVEGSVEPLLSITFLRTISALLPVVSEIPPRSLDSMRLPSMVNEVCVPALAKIPCLFPLMLLHNKLFAVVAAPSTIPSKEVDPVIVRPTMLVLLVERVIGVAVPPLLMTGAAPTAVRKIKVLLLLVVLPEMFSVSLWV